MKASCSLSFQGVALGAGIVKVYWTVITLVISAGTLYDRNEKSTKILLPTNYRAGKAYYFPSDFSRVVSLLDRLD